MANIRYFDGTFKRIVNSDLYIAGLFFFIKLSMSLIGFVLTVFTCSTYLLIIRLFVNSDTEIGKIFYYGSMLLMTPLAIAMLVLSFFWAYQVWRQKPWPTKPGKRKGDQEVSWPPFLFLNAK